MLKNEMVAVIGVLGLACAGCGIHAATALADDSPSRPRSKPPATQDPQVRTVVFQDSDVTRQTDPTITFDSSGSPKMVGGGEVKLLRGIVDAGDRKVAIYMPSKGPYSNVNTGHMENFDNTATCLMIDNAGTKQFHESDRWYANRPMRIGDQMFSAKKIASDGGWMQLVPVKVPLGGAIVGLPCPDYTYRTTDGRQLSNKDFAGKSMVIDIWSMT